MAADDPIIVEAVADTPPASWIPIVGPETFDFLQTVVPKGSRDTVREAEYQFLPKELLLLATQDRKQDW